MNIIPSVKKYDKNGKKLKISKIHWNFENVSDTRVKNAALRISRDFSDGFPVTVCHSNTSDEGYTIDIGENDIKISSNGAAGAFYGLQTFSQLIEDEPECGRITDFADMKHRGFYHDITRGKVPKLQTLKNLIDRLAFLKINSLQLYVEHAFEFKAYEFCRERLGYITAAELKELDDYCYERFIDFTPSLACFGHLYHLLQDGPYKHLAELTDYEPYLDHFVERRMHHTINPLLDESFELIKSLLDEYMPLFRSEYFNICCDETFDLGKGVNEGKEVGELYFGFVNKIIDYITSKGKKVMMWGDVLVNHPCQAKKLPDGITFLSWEYTENPPVERFKILHELGKKQIMCPGTNSWYSFTENVATEEINIAILADYASKYDGEGILNTNWGDDGNLATIPMAYYGMTCGAAVSWDSNTEFNSDFRRAVSERFYGHKDAVDLIAELSPMQKSANWFEMRYLISAYKTSPSSKYYDKARLDIKAITDKSPGKEEYRKLIDRCAVLEKKILSMETLNSDIRRDMLTSVRGNALLLKWNANLREIEVDCTVDFDEWKEDFCREWLENNKKSELDYIIGIFDTAENAKQYLHKYDR